MNPQRFPERRRAACSPCAPVAGSADCSARTMRPQIKPKHRHGIIRRSFLAANTFESIQRKILRQANGTELFRRKHAYAKFTILDMLFLSHELVHAVGERLKQILQQATKPYGNWRADTTALCAVIFPSRNIFKIRPFGDKRK